MVEQMFLRQSMMVGELPVTSLNMLWNQAGRRRKYVGCVVSDRFFLSQIDYRGWCVRVNKDGRMIPTTSGIRSPGYWIKPPWRCIYSDNRGPWNGSSSLKHRRSDHFRAILRLKMVWFAEKNMEVCQWFQTQIVGSRKNVREWRNMFPPALVLPHGNR